MIKEALIAAMTGVVCFVIGLVIGTGATFPEKSQKPLNVICTWDMPADQVGADLPPLPIFKP